MKFRKIVLFFAWVFIAFSLSARSYSTEAAGEINNPKGKVDVMRNGQNAWGAAMQGLPLGGGDRIKTGPRSMCDMELDDGSMIHLAANSETKIESLEIKEGQNVSAFSLFVGKMIASINKLKVTKMQVHTPMCVAALRGTEFAVDTSSSETEVGVFDGAVAVKNTDLSGEELETMVQKDQETKVAAGQKPLPPGKLGEVMLKNREYMTELRDRVRQLKEKLKRVPPAERAETRQHIAERFEKLRSERQDLRLKIEERNKDLK